MHYNKSDHSNEFISVIRVFKEICKSQERSREGTVPVDTIIKVSVAVGDLRLI